jgi:hypothetical protein
MSDGEQRHWERLGQFFWSSRTLIDEPLDAVALEKSYGVLSLWRAARH